MAAVRPVKLAAALVGLFITTNLLLAAERYRIEKASIVVTCPMTIGGSFETRTTALAGELALVPEAAGSVRGTLTVNLKTLKTGISLRDTHLRDHFLEVDRGPEFAVATLNEIRINNLNGPGHFSGKLMVHGVAREVSGTATVRRDSRGFRVDASFPLRVSDFQISRPSYLGVGVTDDIQVHVNLTATATEDIH